MDLFHMASAVAFIPLCLTPNVPVAMIISELELVTCPVCIAIVGAAPSLAMFDIPV